MVDLTVDSTFVVDVLGQCDWEGNDSFLSSSMCWFSYS